MAHFRKKPDVIEAWLYAEDNPEPMPEWVKAASLFHKGQLEVLTPEGTMIAYESDWIVRERSGRVRPYNAEMFAATYEAAD